MGRVVLHLGMPKTGTSSIQRWLISHDRDLRREGIAVAGVTLEDRRLHLEVGAGSRNASAVMARYNQLGAPADLLDQLVGQLEALAHQHDTVVLSGEDLAFMLTDRVEAFTSRVAALGRAVETTVVYYVRPQHTMLEALWQQSHFRRPPSPAAFVRRHTARLDHAAVLDDAGPALGPVSLVVRPFRADLLESASAVVDFARHGLGLADDLGAGDVRVNERVPLELANLLRVAPDGVRRDPELRTMLQRQLGGRDVTPSEEVARAHLLLWRWCFDTFEPSNERLLAARGWPTSHFIDPPEAAGPVELDELDELWRPRASQPEREVVFALAQVAQAERARADDLARRLAEADAPGDEPRGAPPAAVPTEVPRPRRRPDRADLARVGRAGRRAGRRVARRVRRPPAPDQPAPDQPASGRPAHVVDRAAVVEALARPDAVGARVIEAIVDRCDEVHRRRSLDDLLALPPSWNLFQFDAHLLELSVASMATGDEAHLDHALVLLDALADVWTTLPQDRDLFPPYTVMTLGAVADLLPEGADTERAGIRRLVGALGERMTAGYHEADVGRPDRIAWNHAAIVAGGIALAGLLCPDHPEAATWRRLGSERTRAFLDSGLSAQGVTYEGLHYCGFVFRMLGAVLAAMGSTGTVESLVPSGSAVEDRLRAVPAWYARSVWPRGSFVDNHNDSPANPHGAMYGFLRTFARLEPALCAAVWERTLGDGGLRTLGAHPAMSSLVDSLLFLPTEPPAPDALDGLDLDLVDREVGLVSSRDRWGPDATVVTFTTGRAPCEMHGQSDKGAYTLVMGGVPVLADSGTANDPTEGSPGSSFGHNLVVFDGRGQRPAGRGALVEGVLGEVVADEHHLALCGDATAAYGAEGYNPVRHAIRHLCFVRGPVPYLVTVDDIEPDGDPHRFELLLQAHGGTVPELPATGDEVVLGGWRLDRSRPALRVRVLHPTPVALSVDDLRCRLGPPGDHPVVRCATEAVNPRFVLAHLPPTGPEPEITTALDDDGVEVRLLWPHGTDVVRVGWAHGGEPSAPRFERT